VVHHREAPGAHRAGANVAHLAALDEVVQHPHRLLYGGEGIEPVDLEEVDVGRVEALQAGVNGVKDRRAREAVLVHVVTLLAELWVLEAVHTDVVGDQVLHFGGDDDFVPGDVVLEDWG
jgi:hypothetical protein